MLQHTRPAIYRTSRFIDDASMIELVPLGAAQPRLAYLSSTLIAEMELRFQMKGPTLATVFLAGMER